MWSCVTTGSRMWEMEHALTRFSDEERQLVKTLYVVLGSARRVREQLSQMWSMQLGEGEEAITVPPVRIPEISTIEKWGRDHEIRIDEGFVDLYRAELHLRARASAARVIRRAERALMNALKANDSIASKNYSAVWSAASDRMLGRVESQVGGGTTFNILTFTAAEPRQIAPPAPPEPRPIVVEVFDVEPEGIEV